MQAVHYLIDSDGRSHTSPFELLRQATEPGVAEHALITRAVERLCYLHVQEWPRGLIISYRRPATNPVTLAGAIFLLSDLADRRVIFSVFDRHVRYALCRGRSQAIARLVHEMRDLEAEAPQTAHTASDVELPPRSMRSAAKPNTR
jgi:hypothetical protein